MRMLNMSIIRNIDIGLPWCDNVRVRSNGDDVPSTPNHKQATLKMIHSYFNLTKGCLLLQNKASEMLLPWTFS